MPKAYGEVVRHHIDVLGRRSFELPDPPGSLWPLRDRDRRRRVTRRLRRLAELVHRAAKTVQIKLYNLSCGF
ncbi:hypothetical protein DKM19_23585 [Streptosporangium sp. 'caverna']|nr:hypothetical protein DKM19_23585 [Streptosporangium sp. 'caverna']